MILFNLKYFDWFFRKSLFQIFKDDNHLNAQLVLYFYNNLFYYIFKLQLEKFPSLKKREQEKDQMEKILPVPVVVPRRPTGCQVSVEGEKRNVIKKH